MDKTDFYEIVMYVVVGILVSFLLSIVVFAIYSMFNESQTNIEIQRVKQVDDGYYITINNEVYEYLEG